jgi:hypothetical protein
LKGIFESQSEAYGYLQRFLGRITFLYFLQRKGWLDKDRAYLKKRLNKLDGSSMYDFLYELFDALNTPGKSKRSHLGQIPFLNGSLFEKENLSQTKTRILRSAIAPLLPGILHAFGSYNFTISESTPLDKEVAVDPELLGSIFESMLPETERGDKGTFYTHQEEMLFMAREGLGCFLRNFNHLINHDIINFLVYGSELGSTFKPGVAREVRDLVRKIKILDPAVGSGGFLLASLQVLLEIRRRLNKVIGSTETNYDAKLEIIENNLFGVDIEYEAIELSRLRLWLSLVVDEELENVRTLPNLDYNLHQGDSLKVPDFEQSRYINVTADPTIRDALLKDIAITREEFSRSHGIEKEKKSVELQMAFRKLSELETGTSPPKILPFSYKYFFPDVMSTGGFDMILMNPPYIQQQDIGKLQGQNPSKYKSEISEDITLLTDNEFIPSKQSDISVYFLVRALSLLNEDGVSVVIATSKWLDVKYGAALQNYLLSNATIEFIYDSVDRSFAADVNTTITVIRRKKSHPNNFVSFVLFKIGFKDVSEQIIESLRKIQREGYTNDIPYHVNRLTVKDLFEAGIAFESEQSDEESNKKLDIHQENQATEKRTSMLVENGVLSICMLLNSTSD